MAYPLFCLTKDTAFQKVAAVLGVTAFYTTRSGLQAASDPKGVVLVGPDFVGEKVIPGHKMLYFDIATEKRATIARPDHPDHPDHIVLPTRLAIIEAALADLSRVRRDYQQKLGPHVYESKRRRLVGKKKTLKLTEKEAEILNFLLAQKDATASKKVLLENVWQYHPHASSHTIETHIYKLRQKLEKDPDKPKILLTSKKGYRLKG